MGLSAMRADSLASCGLLLLLSYAGIVLSSDAVFYATVPSNAGYGDYVISLPTKEGLTYKVSPNNVDPTASRFAVTRNGKIYVQSFLEGLGNTRVKFVVRARDKLHGHVYKVKVDLHIIDSKHSREHPAEKYKAPYSRTKRATEVQISKDVSETAVEVTLDYSSRFIISTNTKFYLQEDNEIFNVETSTGKLLVKSGMKMDYETTRNYQLTVYVNGTNTDYLVAVTVRLIDVNDERPVFTMKPRPYLGTMDPNLPADPATVVYRLTVDDKDADSNIRYTLDSINPRDGDFTLRGDGIIEARGPFPSGRTYTLTVTATDTNAVSNGPQQVTAQIQMIAGNRDPQFFEATYQATIPENADRGTELDITIQAKSFQGETINYVLSPQGHGFELAQSSKTPNARVLKTTRRLDYEVDTKSYQFTVTARERDSGRSTSIPLRVILEDLNDNKPRFDLSEYVIDEAFPEDVTSGTFITTVKAEDNDSGDNGRITYSVDQSGDKLLPFEIETKYENGEYVGYIKTLGTLDYDTTPSTGYRLRVIAVDAGSVPQSGTAMVRVKVSDKNDESPIFQPPRVETVEPDKAVGSLVTTVHASDLDYRDGITYSFVTTNGYTLQIDPFRIDADTGSIYLTQALSSLMWADTSSFIRNVSAMDDGMCCQDDAGGNRGFTIVTIEVVGRNNPPEFRDCDSYSNLAEVVEEQRGASVIQVQATDDDKGENGRLTYQLVSSLNNKFAIDEDTGEITTIVASVDREETTHVTLTVKAVDHAQSPLSSFCTFTMKVVDVNDNDPVLDIVAFKDVEVNSPVGSNMYQLYASDRDFGLNKEIVFSLTGNDNFEVDVDIIKNKVPLSQILTRVQTMTVIATDRGTPPRSTSRTFTLNIVQTANAPFFLDETIFSNTLEIKENLQDDYIIARLKATAYDGGPVNYFLVPQTTDETFHMRTDEQSCIENNELCLAIYKSEKLDADVRQLYSIRIRVTPRDVGSFVVTEKSLNVKVLDVNDNIPNFENKDDNGYVIGQVEEEKNLFEQDFLVLNAIDSDITREFQTASYSIMEVQDYQQFLIDGTTGRLSVATTQKFDRETKASWFIQVEARDGADSSRPATNGPNKRIGLVQINIIDVNDNRPYFEQSQYDGSVQETAAQGAVVMSVRASDLDIVNTFRYRFVSGNVGNVFQVNERGDIIVLGKLDYETKKEYVMQLQVSDGIAEAEQPTTVKIEIVDMNDNEPVFDQSVYKVLDVEEEDTTITATNRREIVTVHATDADVDRVLNIRYELEGANSDKFEIDHSSGKVFLVTHLDRDPPIGRAQWDVNVLARDEHDKPTSRIGFAIISVLPIDINDNSPEFDQDSLTGSVSENTNSPVLVMSVVANDRDAGKNGAVKYRLLGDTIQSVTGEDYPTSTKPWFTMQPTGALYTAAVFDREMVGAYTMQVVAYDEGSPPSPPSTGTATVMIQDENDNKPEFQPDTYAKKVSEFAGPESYIVKVLAQDPDSDDVLAYDLDENAKKNFSIDESGVIRLRDKGLDFEHFFYAENGPIPATIDITVTVQDGGQPSAEHSDTAAVTITVIDENDEYPVFETPEVSVQVIENVTIGKEIYQFTATDRDAKIENSAIEYLIDRTLGSDSDRYFAVNPLTGIVTTQKSLDRETIPKHTVRVLAVDSGFPDRLTGTAVLEVTLLDINDNAPEFADPFVTINENMPAGTFVIPNPIKAVDPDDDDLGHGPPFFMEATGTSNDFEFKFYPELDVPEGSTVGNGAGEIKSLRQLDREGNDGSERIFPILLRDQDGQEAVRDLIIMISDEDDNPPSSGHRDALIYNYETWELEYTNVEIGDCYAPDPDANDQMYKTYGKVGTWPNGFDIDVNSGMITADLSKLPSAVYNFKCTVTDRYIKDASCAYECNVAGGPPVRVDACKDTCRVAVTVQSTVTASIKYLTQQPVTGGVSIRLKGSADDFLMAKSGGEKSSYDRFKDFLAQQLHTIPDYVDIFTVLDTEDKEGYVDVRFTAHGSPYYNSSRLIGTVQDNMDAFAGAVGLELDQVPINECMKEVCEGGCSNKLNVTDAPTLVNAPGNSLVGVTAKVTRSCGCAATDYSTVLTCNPESCLNGGVCIFNEDSETTSCICPHGFDGPRCQQLRHSFSGNGWAQYPTLTQCKGGSTSIQVLTRQSNGLIFYNGPNKDPGNDVDSITDYIALGIINGQPVLFLDHGTGFLRLSVPVNINDGVWHKIDVFRNERDTTLTIDDCRGAAPPTTDTSNTTLTRESCEAVGTTNGENKYLNVDTLLEMGGRNADAWWPASIQSVMKNNYDGCVKSFKHNGELYDLYMGKNGRHFNTEDGCAREDSICTDNDKPVCGENGICEASLNSNGFSCTCKPGYQAPKCAQETEFMDFQKSSFIEWSFSQDYWVNAKQKSFTNFIQLVFRSRDIDGSGLLFSATGGSGEEYIKLQITNHYLTLRYFIGSDGIGIDENLQEQISLPYVRVTDGSKHVVSIERIGKRVIMKLDGGEGRYYGENEGPYSHQLFVIDELTLAGADVNTQDINGGFSSTTDLENSCVTDVRYDKVTYPVTASEDQDNENVQIKRRENVADGCANTACENDPCQGRGLQVCVDLWRKHACSCPFGWEDLLTAPFCEDENECFTSNPCTYGDCVNTPGSFECRCWNEPNTNKPYRGTLCNVQPLTSKKSLASSGLIALFITLLIVLVIILALFMFVRRRQMHVKGEPLYDPYDDMRETIYNYDEEGMPEEDQDGYDISRLSKPVNPIIPQPIMDKPLMGAAPRRPDQPDVGDFISGRLNDADDDPTQCPGDSLKNYAYEGSGSDAGSLSSLNTSSSGGDHDYDYLNDWGPKFARLADMYGGGDDA